MTSWPQPTRKDHETFCRTEEWRRVRDAHGRTVTYELDLVDGRVLRTRISHPVDRSDYGPGIWRHILRDQLEADEPTFWSCVRDGVKPARGTPRPSAEALPADLVQLLIARVGLDDADVAAMSKDEAIVRIQRHWADGS